MGGASGKESKLYGIKELKHSLGVVYRLVIHYWQPINVSINSALRASLMHLDRLPVVNYQPVHHCHECFNPLVYTYQVS